VSEPASEIRHSVFIRAPRAKVWAALTTGQAMDAWWGTRGSEIDLRPGGKLTLRWRGWGPERDINADRECDVVEVVPPKRFVFRWGETADKMTTVEFELEERPGRHAGAPPGAWFRTHGEGARVLRREFARLG
jgi:uncharacterized protein YndB with AHSA1/START domain